MDYPKVMQFDCGADERETQINIDHFGKSVEVFTSHNAVYRRLIKRGLEPVKVNEGGAIFRLKTSELGKIPMSTVFKTN